MTCATQIHFVGTGVKSSLVVSCGDNDDDANDDVNRVNCILMSVVKAALITAI